MYRKAAVRTGRVVASYRVAVHLKILNTLFGDEISRDMSRHLVISVSSRLHLGSSRLALSRKKLASFQDRVHLKKIIRDDDLGSSRLF